MDNTAFIRTWLNIGLGAKLLQTAAQLFIWLIMGCRDMSRLVLLPLISAAVFFAVFRWLRARSKQSPNPAEGEKMLVIGAAVPFVCTMALMGIDYILRWYVWNNVYSLEEIRLLDVVKTYQDGAAFLNIAAIIAFAAAAGMLCRRCHEAEPST
jgi:hypothetical protein